MEKLRKQRGASRASFSRTLKLLRIELRQEELDMGLIKDSTAKIDNIMSEIKSFDGKIIDLIAEDKESTEELILAEKEDCEKYSDEYITIKRLVSEILSSDKSIVRNVMPNASLGNDSRPKYYKYPKLNIKPFDGLFINYLSFWSQFQKIHEDTELDECDKFQYLLQSVQPNTRARELLESYPITSQNYSKAVTAFQERFGNKDILVEVYVREFLKLIIDNVQSNRRNKLQLPDLFTKVDAYLRSLESLGLKSENNSAWLYPMIESCLPEETLKAWQRYSLLSSSHNNDPEKSNLDLLMNFLRREVEGEERLKLARKGFEDNDFTRHKGTGKDKLFRKETSIPTAASLYSIKEQTCIFCEKSHESKDCITARSFSLQEKTEKVKEKNCCLKCLRKGHRAKVCKVFIRCHVCTKPHTELFCPELVKRSSGEKKETAQKSSEIMQSTVTQKSCSGEIALMTVEVIIQGDTSKKVRALFDCGSQKSYILKRTAKEIGSEAISTENLAHCLFGGGHIETKPHCKYKVKLKPSMKRSTVFEFEFLDQEVICGNLPRVPKEAILQELKKHRIWLTDVGTGCPEIELLIGSDLYGQLLTGRVKQLRRDLTAIETKLGWTVCGHVQTSESAASGAAILINNLSVREMKVPELWRLETIGILDPVETMSKAEEDELAHDHFLKEVTRKEDGRYCVSLPWIDDKREIPCNRQVAEKRLMSVTRKLKTLGKLEDYNKVFQEWEEEGVISKVPDTELKFSGHYLPHHAVIKPQSLSTTIRPVFDASCKLGRSPSLNDCLFKGPNLIEQIPSILLRFREKPVAVIADIRRAFLQIEVNKNDRQFLRFLWWEKPEKIQVYQHNRVIFGATCSPFLLGAVIKLHLSNASEENKQIASKLANSFYVDNLVTSIDDISEIEKFVAKSTELMEEAKMTLRMWEYGPLEENEFLEGEKSLEGTPKSTVPVLGLLWDKREDCLMVKSQLDKKNENLTKRQILSIVQGIFDPIGFLSPALLPGKLMIQEAWLTKTDWDSLLPEIIQKDFTKWYDQLEILASVKIPRRIGYGDKQGWTLHTFCDASQKAYASVIFLRCEDGSGVSVQLLSAKSRLSPKKNVTIPRLELLACVLGTRLTSYIQKSLDLSTVQVYFWTDSSTALAWIRRNNQWGTFVGNRIREICKLTEAHQWFFIPGHLNPADLPSRGCLPSQFVKSRWWEGPRWLRNSEDEWPKMEIPPHTQEELVNAEARKTVAINLDCNYEAPFMNFQRISKFSKIVKVICWVKRFILKCKNPTCYFPRELSSTEKEEAENSLWLTIQKEHFGNAEDSVKGLVVVKDHNNILRVKTKILDREDEFSFRYPILLPSKHHVVSCLIQEYHLKNCHAGPQTIRSLLREKFWIISSKRNIKSVLSKCVKCKRFSAKAIATPPIHLPLDRVRDSRAFEVVGIDLCGPLFLRQKNKVWIVLFTCAVYRAIHLELVTSLSTEIFIQSLRRFIARRGRPITIYTDNGTNFTGTNNILKNLDWGKIEASEELVPLKWKFIPPTAAWWGGWWERLIRSIKSLLIRILGRSSVNFEELTTILCDVEATVNSRPLTCITDQVDDLVPLTPAMFIQDIAEVGVPDLDKIDSGKLQARFKVCQSLRKELRSRFRKEYLSELVQKANEQGQTIQKDDIVLVENIHQKRLSWPLGRVMKLLPSRDKCARVAQVRTASGTLIRPIRKLYPLEIGKENHILKEVVEIRTRSGRLVKIPSRTV